jgi:peptidoglycan-associated lipoprotein
MNSIKFGKTVILAFVIGMVAVGCRKSPLGVQALPDYKRGMVGEAPIAASITNSETLGSTPGGETPAGIPMADPATRADWPRDREIFKKDTVYFDFDSSVVRAGEKSKVAAVAEHMKANPKQGLEVEGHCDERGTEEYNRSLGERRALALREELARLGVDPAKIDTTSFGKDRPAATGKGEAAYRKNRRGEFVLELPPK